MNINLPEIDSATNHYLIGYATGNGQHGHVEISTDPICTMADVLAVQRSLRQQLGIADLMVLSFSRFDTEATSGNGGRR